MVCCWKVSEVVVPGTTRHLANWVDWLIDWLTRWSDLLDYSQTQQAALHAQIKQVVSGNRKQEEEELKKKAEEENKQQSKTVVSLSLPGNNFEEIRSIFVIIISILLFFENSNGYILLWIKYRVISVVLLWRST